MIKSRLVSSFSCFAEQHPGVGGIRFSIPKRNKMQQPNGDMNSYTGPPPNNNFNKQQRFMGPRGPRVPVMPNNSANQNNAILENTTNECPAVPNEGKVKYVIISCPNFS